MTASRIIDENRLKLALSSNAVDPALSAHSVDLDLNGPCRGRIRYSQESILEELAKIGKASPGDQMTKARKLINDLFGSREKSLGVIGDVLGQFSRSEWETPTNFNPNGFFKMSLGKAEGTALRLHFNPPGVPIPEGGRIEENVHDHRWNFVSVLLSGEFKHTLFKDGEEGDPRTEVMHQYSYSPRGGKEIFQMRPLGEALVKRIKDISPQLHKPFSMKPSVIHRAAYPLRDQALTVTAVITVEDSSRDFNFVWANDEIHRQIQDSKNTTPTPKCGKEIQAKLLSDLMEALS